MKSRKSIQEHLNGYCHFANIGDHIECCEWSNGEGFDLTISSTLGHRIISVTYGEYDAIQEVLNRLKYES